MLDPIPMERKNSHLSQLLAPFEELERNFFGDLARSFPCKTDILDLGDHYIVKADLPGFRKEEIHINLTGDTLTISADRQEEQAEKSAGYLRRERRIGGMRRSLQITDIDTEHICAGYQNGVLELKLKKRAGSVPPSRQIEIN